ncbi:hypothetical protein O3299_10025 [Janthinobacterium sp. SUN176]|uniref:hypothetical protein n=1 Tax=Janthinobacterium sp. SUN176 TaxID=3014788 RepID=UPI0027128385|nr:hypothetical protein [Janthinobacterium sp. SUN176]MDO8071869.1 hypothetical protein [Janthinobacterium sp. SUN176]
MKNKNISGNKSNIADFDESTIPMSLFMLSNSVSEKNSQEFLRLSKLARSEKRKIENVRGLKKIEKEIYIKSGAFEALKRDFHIDGAIKIGATELLEFNKFIERAGEIGYIENYFESAEDMLSDILRFGYFSGGDFIFRGPEYYFLMNGINVENFDKFTSINDFIISDININDFIDSIFSQYNYIDRHLKIYANVAMMEFHLGLGEKKEIFCKKIKEVLLKDKIARIRESIKSGQYFTGHVGVDTLLNSQWEEALVMLEHFNELVEKYEISEEAEDFRMMAIFLARNSDLFVHCKIVFGIDIDAIVESHFRMEMAQVIRKMVLGLLDAKMNILAFIQNVFQIVTNINFLDPEYPGSLIVERDVVRNIQKNCPVEFAEFKKIQETYVGKYLENPLLPKLDEVVGHFISILLKNTAVSYMRMPDFGNNSSKSNENYDNFTPKIFNDFLKVTKSFFKLIESFLLVRELAEQKKEQKKSKNGLEYVRNDRHNRIKQQIFRRLIRLYREENSPLVMIKTAQNALNFVLLRGYEAKNDVLHIMSVNYGGALTGFFAKQVFLHCVKNGTALLNTASVIYSLYDVRNANSFDHLTGYPFSNVISDSTMPETIRNNFSEKNWLLIFDDNTNSGETLDNIRMLAKETGFFGRIDMFPCRASFNFDNYKSSLNEHQKLAMIVSSAIEVRRSKVNPKGLRYIELLGAIVGHRLWKIKNKKTIHHA